MTEAQSRQLAIDALKKFPIKEVFLPDRIHFTKTGKGTAILGFTKQDGADIEVRAIHIVPEQLEFLYHQIGSFLGKTS